MKQNSKHNEHLVISVSKLNGGIEVREDVSGTLPELLALLTYYIIHFCQQMAKKPATEGGKKFHAKTILLGIIHEAVSGIDDDLMEEEFDE